MARLRCTMLHRILPIFIIVAAVPSFTSATFRLPSPWLWSCVNETCVKRENVGMDLGMSINTCKLTCGPDGVLWPRPTGMTDIGDQTVHFELNELKLQSVVAPTQDVKDLVERAFDIFKSNVATNIPEPDPRQSPATEPQTHEVLRRTVWIKIEISKSGSTTRLTLDTNEAYLMNINTDDQLHTNVTILSSTFFGTRHALETLSQLIEYDDYKGALEIVSSAAISDSPKYKYRGILLDTSRNFFSVKSIERTLDAMAANKLNTFHWHITDSNTFPLYLESLPDMAYYGAYSPKQIYKAKDIHHLVEYGRVRGIRVVPELDAPAHVGNGWQWTEKKGLGQLAVCVNQEPWQSYCVQPPCGQLNIVNNNTYAVLGQIYKEMAKIFGPLDLFHFGGDEVNLNCWNTTEEIVNYLEEHGMNRSDDSFLKLWGDFQASAYDLLTSANEGKQIPGILWTSRLTEKGQMEKYLNPDNYIIQIWTSGHDKLIGDLLQKGFQVIFSNYDAWYLSCGFGSWVGKGDSWCGSYKGWQTVYDNSPSQIALNLTGTLHSNLILGGEAALWSEKTDENSLDSKLWPRGAALGERLWTNPSHNWESAEVRLIHHRQRMVKRGIQADRIQPEWCHQNEGLCYIK